jgi:uncharacterized DUF497 family protein
VSARYDWDPEKAEANLRRHGVPFDEAKSAADSPLASRRTDIEHSSLEDRIRIVGWSDAGHLLVVIASTSGPRPRIISARRATKRERDAYINR